MKSQNHIQIAISIVFALFFPLHSIAENQTPDSTLIHLIKELENHKKEDTLRTKLLYRISNVYLNDQIFELKKSKDYAQKALELSKKQDYNLGLACSYKLLGRIENYQNLH